VRRRLVTAVWILLAAPGVLQLGLLLYTVARRIAYPYDLEWMEGGMLNHALRLSEGQPIYAAPSIDFIPFLYTPLYPALLAALGKLFGLGYLLGRAVSVLAILVTLACIAAAALRETRARGWALAGAGLGGGVFAATYPWVEGWYDLVRGDTLFLAMATAGLLLLRAWARHPARAPFVYPRVAAAAALLALSFFCKQTGVLLVAAGGAALVVMNWRAVPIYGAVAGVIGLGGSALLNRLTGGWYWVYVFEVHQQHETFMPRFWQSFGNMAGRFPALTVLLGVTLVAVAAAAVARRRLPEGAGGFLYWMWMTAAGALIGALGWATQWAHFNAYIPALTFAAIAAALAIVSLADLLPRGSLVVAAAAGAALGAQLVVARWSPRPFIPTAADRQAGAALIARLRALPGELFMPSHPWYPHLAGKPTFTHRMGIMDVTYRPPPSAGKKPLRPEAREVAGLAEALRARRFGAIVLDDRYEAWELPGLTESYQPDELLGRDAAPRVVSGARTVPRTIWTPIETQLPPGTRVLYDFEREGYNGWTITGNAFGNAPARGTPGRGVLGYRGRLYASSSAAGDDGTGSLVSPPIAVTGTRITLRVGGGERAGTRVELRDAASGEVLRSAQGNHDMMLRAVAWDVAELRGQEVRVAAVDEERGAWGIIWLDEIRQEGMP
jgi:hypothetical protein